MEIVLPRGEVVQVDFVEVLRVVLIMCDHVWLSCRGGQVEYITQNASSVRQLLAPDIVPQQNSRSNLSINEVVRLFRFSRSQVTNWAIYLFNSSFLEDHRILVWSNWLLSGLAAAI